MSTLITILHVIVCLFLMLTVLLQSGKGGGMGGAFGGGNAATVFGSSGASNFLKRLTAGAGTIFILTSMLLAFLASHNTADALEKFGEQQEKLASEKEAARKKALESGTGSGSGSGSASGSATMMTPFTPDQGGSGAPPGSAAPAESPAPPGTAPAAPAESPAPSGTAPAAPAESPAPSG
ncbi:MAG TPA: preprotein translocase subunit SecG, partial [Kofleriaceae bacterium]|nr:preprotein translocase subunit SecG [Kofleriaceae bacterium]